jgi:hypothetical protein
VIRQEQITWHTVQLQLLSIASCLCCMGACGGGALTAVSVPCPVLLLVS